MRVSLTGERNIEGELSATSCVAAEEVVAAYVARPPAGLPRLVRWIFGAARRIVSL